MAYMYDAKIMHMQDILSAFLQLLAGPVFNSERADFLWGRFLKPGEDENEKVSFLSKAKFLRKKDNGFIHNIVNTAQAAMVAVLC